MRLFVLLSRVPYPLEKGDKLRAYHQVKELAKKHDIFLCCLNNGQLHPEASTELSKICTRLEIVNLTKVGTVLNLAYAFFSNKPFQVHYFKQAQAVRKVHGFIREFQPDHIYCQLIRTAEYVKDLFETPKTIDFQDALSKGMQRRIEGASLWLKPLLKSEAKRLLTYENLVFEYFDHKTIISAQDRELIYHPLRKEIVVVPNGVDTAFFKPLSTPMDYDLVFTGNMNYPPNIRGAEYLVNEILPLVLHEKPDVRVLISGATPAVKVKALASSHVTVTGWVEDIRTAYARSKVFIAPMQIGTGLQNKILEAMAMERPCVTSELANNALNAKTNETILIGTTPRQYADQVIKLLNDENLSREMGKKGREFVLTHYNWEKTTALLNTLF